MELLRKARLSWRTRRTRRVLVLGGARSGKSTFAERRIARNTSVTYVATAPERPGDAEWQARVGAHRERRPASWRTLETSDLGAVLRTESGPLLVDCAALWLTAAMDDCGVWDGTPDADKKLAARVDDVDEAWRETRAHVVLVSNEVGSGVVPATPAGRRFRDELGALNTRLAAHADEVWLVTAGIPRRLR